MSQSAFVTQNSGCAADLDAVIRLEELDDGLAQLANLVGKTQSCDMGDSNSASNKPGGLPSESQTMAILQQLPELMKEVCMIYAQVMNCSFVLRCMHVCLLPSISLCVRTCEFAYV